MLQPTTSTKKTRKQKDSFNVTAQKRLEQFKAKKAKDNNQLQQLLKAAATNKTKKEQQKKAKKQLTPAQKAKRDKGKAARKNNFAAYMGNKIAQQNKTRVKKSIKQKAIKERQKNGLDNFTDQRSFINFFPNKESALNYLKQTRENENGEIECPHCNKYVNVSLVSDRPNMLECKECERQFSILKDTIYEKSHIPLHRHYDLLFNELFCKVLLTVREAANILDCAMKNAHAALLKVRLYLLMLKAFVIPNGSILIIDTMAVFGKNVNRKDYEKLSKEEIYALSIQVLTIKVKGGITLYYVIDDLSEKSILAVLKKVLPEQCTVICDEHKSFDNIDKIEGKEITLIRCNHSAGDHGDGSAESGNAGLKLNINAHHNVFSRQGVQAMCNATAFKKNTDHLSINQQFDAALKNCVITEKIKIIKKPVKRRSTFVKYITALQMLNPDRVITPEDIRRSAKKAAKIIKMAEALKTNPQTKSGKRSIAAQIQQLIKAA